MHCPRNLHHLGLDNQPMHSCYAPIISIGIIYVQFLPDVSTNATYNIYMLQAIDLTFTSVCPCISGSPDIKATSMVFANAVLQ